MAAFAAAEGHSRVPDLYKGSPQLGTWVSTQRSRFREGLLLPSRQKRLEMLKGWDWQPPEGMRERYLTELHTYVKATGSADVPADYVTGDGFALGASLIRIRRMHRRGTLSARRTADLEAIQGWNWDSGLRPGSPTDFFLDMYRALVEREGHGHVPGAHLEDGFRLGRSLVSARHRMKKGALAQARMDALDAIDPSWRRGQHDSQREKVRANADSNSLVA